MKHIIFSITVLVCTLKLYGQQVADPTTNVPKDVTLKAHNYVDPIGVYPSSISPTFRREWELEVPVQVGPDLDLNFTNARVKTEYFDGLRRPIQTVQRKATDNFEDLNSAYQYDILGREPLSFLPYHRDANVSTGKFDFNPSSGLNSTYNPISNGSYDEPFSKTEFDNSPLNGVKKTFAPGKAWIGEGRYNSKTAGTNSAWIVPAGTVTGGYPRWIISGSNLALPQYVGDYPIGSLTSEGLIDEDGNVSETFKDNAGKTVFTRRRLNKQANPTPLDYAYTCYVYDDLGRVRCVIPPMAARPTASGLSYTWQLTQNELDNLCYQYYFDYKGRQIEKQMPGKQREYFVYDKWDRIVFNKDGNLSNIGKWAFTLYDERNNPIMTGLYGEQISRVDMQILVDMRYEITDEMIFYYVKTLSSANSYPSTIPNCKILTKTYFTEYTGDLLSYNFDGSVFSSTNDPAFMVPFKKSKRTQELVTGTKIRVMDPDDPNADNWLTTVNFYDDNGRLIQQHATNIQGGVDVTSYRYTFRGDIYYKALNHYNPAAKVPEEAASFLSSDYMQRLKLKTTYKINIGGNGRTWQYQLGINDGLPSTMASYEYDHLGNLKLKNFTPVTTEYRYNVRNWLTSISANLIQQSTMPSCFEENICYNEGFESKIFNGNIAGITWRGAGSNAPKRFYGYSYDDLGRLTHAQFGEKTGNDPYNTNNNDFTVSNLEYDLNGNIQHMTQMGVDPATNNKIVMDELTYEYYPNSNQLQRVSDVGNNDTRLPDFKDLASFNIEYSYDLNGNLTLDENKGVAEITYNHLNKPEKVIMPGKGIVTFVYDALGNRLQKRIYDEIQNKQIIYDFINIFTYKNNYLQEFATDEGRSRPYFYNGAGNFGLPTNPSIKYKHDFYVKDHLGNVRDVVTNDYSPMLYFASHEIGSANVEQLVFDNIEVVRDPKPGSTNPEDVMAAHLIAEDPEKRIGTSLMLRVMPEDEFELSADAFYEGEYKGSESLPTEDILGSLINTLSGGVTFEGTPIAELPENMQILNQTLNNPALPSLMNQIATANESVSAPKAYLNYLVFDEKMNLDIATSGRVQISADPNLWSTIAPSSKIKVRDAGYIIIFIENGTLGTPVYFDKVKVNLTKGRVTEENHYYPFGLTLTTQSNNPLEVNNIKFNSKELLSKEFEDNLGIKTGLELYDFGARMFDPQLGRWNGSDMLSEKSYDYSPYCYTSNNPVLFVDPDGNANMVYLINLPGSGISASQMEAIKTEANASLHAMGLGIDVKVFSDSKSFEFANLVSSESVVIFGQPKDITEYVTNTIGDPYLGNKLSFWKGDFDNPEVSESTFDWRGGTHDAPGIVSVSSTGMKGFLDYFNSVYNGKDNIASVGAFIALHGLGHNSGLTGHRSESDAALNTSGNRDLQLYGREGWKSWKDFMTNKDGRNSKYIEQMKTKFTFKFSFETYDIEDVLNDDARSIFYRGRQH